MEQSLKTIPFLNAKIKINDTSIETWVYKKPTNTNRFLNSHQVEDWFIFLFT